MNPDLDCWSPDVAKLGAVLAKLLPEIEPVEPLQMVGEGFRSVAVETATGVLLRIGKIEEAAAGFELESRALPFVRRHIQAHIPDPRWRILPCDELPFGALGYMKLPGTIPEPGDPALARFFVPELAEFMVRLHSLPVSEALAAGVPRVNPHERLLGARPVVMPLLKERLERDACDRLERWWDEFASYKTASYPETVCHHDLWHENLLVDSEAHLSGVLDWSHIEIGDRAHDFAAAHHFGGALTEKLIAAYRAAGGKLDDHDLRRVQLYWKGRQLGGLAWAIENDNNAETEAAIQKVLKGPIFD